MVVLVAVLVNGLWVERVGVGVVMSVVVEVVVAMVDPVAVAAAGSQETGENEDEDEDEDNHVLLRSGEENDSKEVSLSGFKTFEKMFL